MRTSGEIGTQNSGHGVTKARLGITVANSGWKTQSLGW